MEEIEGVTEGTRRDEILHLVSLVSDSAMRQDPSAFYALQDIVAADQQMPPVLRLQEHLLENKGAGSRTGEKDSVTKGSGEQLRDKHSELMATIFAADLEEMRATDEAFTGTPDQIQLLRDALVCDLRPT